MEAQVLSRFEREGEEERRGAAWAQHDLWATEWWDQLKT